MLSQTDRMDDQLHLGWSAGRTPAKQNKRVYIALNRDFLRRAWWDDSTLYVIPSEHLLQSNYRAVVFAAAFPAEPVNAGTCDMAFM